MAIVVHAGLNKTVNTINDRNALSKKRDGMMVYVKDSIADIDAGAGSALYRYEKDVKTWFMVSKTNNPTMKFKKESLLINNDTVTCTNIPTDNMIWNINVVKDNVIYASDFDYSITNGIVTLAFDEVGQFDGYNLSFTYAHGSITEQMSIVLKEKYSVNENQEIIGDIVPSIADTYTLGTPLKPFKDLYVGANSLYVNGNKVISNNDGTMKFTADDNQSVELNASGTGSLALTTTGDGDITINPSGTGNIELKGTIEVSSGVKVRTSDGSALHVDQDIEIRGNVIADSLNGKTVETSVPINAEFTDTETLTVLSFTNNILTYRDENNTLKNIDLSETLIAKGSVPLFYEQSTDPILDNDKTIKAGDTWHDLSGIVSRALTLDNTLIWMEI